MKNVLIITFVLLTGIGFSQTKKKLLTPKKSVAKVVLTGKNDYTYYAMSQTDQTTYEVVGPGKLELSCRVRLEGNTFESKAFSIKCYTGKSNLKSYSVPQLKAGNLKMKSASLKGTPTKMHTLTIDVPPGKYRYRLYKGTAQKVYIKARYKKLPKPKWVVAAPNNAVTTKTVQFVKSGKERMYYSLTKQGTAFEFTVKDSADVKLLVRPEFDYKMLGTAQVKIKVRNQRTGEETVYKMNCGKSSSVVFKDDKQHTPGSSKAVYLTLPASASGDTYEITLVNGAKRTSIRVFTKQKPVTA